MYICLNVSIFSTNHLVLANFKNVKYFCENRMPQYFLHEAVHVNVLFSDTIKSESVLFTYSLAGSPPESVLKVLIIAGKLSGFLRSLICSTTKSGLFPFALTPPTIDVPDAPVDDPEINREFVKQQNNGAQDSHA